jgi:RNA polymerase sigma factor (sigma-70 family)
LYRRHAPRLHRYVARRAGSDAADDVASETFLVAFERRASFDSAWDDAAPWLFGIATVLIHKHRRAEARIFRTLARAAGDEAAPDEHARAADLIDASAQLKTMATHVRRMSTADRDTLLLYAWAELSYEQIAAAMQVPIGTVRSRLNRARRVLRNTTSKETEHGRTDPAPRNA